jgi:hypothetical protein
VYALSPLDPKGLRRLHVNCAQTIVSRKHGLRHCGLAGMVLLTAGLPRDAGFDEHVQPFLKRVTYPQFHRAARYVDAQHSALVERARHRLAGGCTGRPIEIVPVEQEIRPVQD